MDEHYGIMTLMSLAGTILEDGLDAPSADSKYSNFNNFQKLEIDLTDQIWRVLYLLLDPYHFAARNKARARYFASLEYFILFPTQVEIKYEKNMTERK